MDNTSGFLKREAEAVIFDLRKKADALLRAGCVEEFNHLQLTISYLQEVYGATKGAERKRKNDRTAA